LSSSTDRVPIGRIGKPHGVRGEVYLQPLTDRPDRFAPGASFVTDEVPPRSLTIETVRSHHDRLLVRFTAAGDRAAAEDLRGAQLTIGRDERRKLDAGEFWEDDLVGLPVRNAAGLPLGTVAGVVFASAQDRLVVDAPQGRIEVPFVEGIVTEVDPEAGVVVDPPEGLFP
jgi:16S rRNA processing protein RimM